MERPVVAAVAGRSRESQRRPEVAVARMAWREARSAGSREAMTFS